MSSLQPSRLSQLTTAPPSAKQSTSAYEIKNLYKPKSSPSLAFSSTRSTPSPTLSFAPSSHSDGNSSNNSPPSSPEADAHPSSMGEEDEDEAADSVPAPLPSFTVRPKGIAERERERASGKKAMSMAASMARKRAAESMWAKYDNFSGVVELNLSPDDLKRM